MTDAQPSHADQRSEQERSTFAAVREWVILVLGIGLIIYSLIAGNAAGLTLGAGLCGYNPITRAAV